MNDRIYMSSPDVGDLEKEYLLEAFDSGWIAPLGPAVDAFEADIKERIGVEYVVALNSGTAALHLGLIALGVKPGDTVVTSTMTFAATSNAIKYVGATPYFIDCDLATGNIDTELTEQAIQSLIAQGKKPAAILPVDLLGKPADATRLQELSEEYQIPLFIDAAESLGAMHRGRPAGSFGDASILSFNGNKVITTSGGGAFLTNNKDLAHKVRYLSTQARQPVVHYEHLDIGYNYRLSNLLAALGRAQLSRLNPMLKKRKELRDLYRQLFDSVPGVSIFGDSAHNENEDNYWLTSVIIDSNITGWSSKQLFEWFQEANIESRPLWKPMHLQPVFKHERQLVNGSSEYLFNNGLTLPSGSSLTEFQIQRIVTSIQEFLESR